MRTTPDSARQRGFSLLETLVAFAVLALALGVLLRVFAGSGRSVALSEEYARGIAAAESLLANLDAGPPLRPGVSEGQLGERYRWLLQVTPLPLGAQIPPDRALGYRPYWLELGLAWGREGERHQVVLRSVRLLTEQTPTAGAR